MCIYMYICVIMKTMCPPSYHHNGFVATHALGLMITYIFIYIYLTVAVKKIYHRATPCFITFSFFIAKQEC